MNRLPQNLFNHIRSHLTVQELHQTRSVSSEWQTISSVPVILDCDTRRVPPHAEWRNIQRMVNYPYFEDDPQAFLRMVTQSSHRLTHIITNYWRVLPPNTTNIPQLNSLECLKIFGSRNSQIPTVRALMASAPNLKKLGLISAELLPNLQLDLQTFPMLEHVSLFMNDVGSHPPSFKNLENSHLKKATLSFHLVSDCVSAIPFIQNIIPHAKVEIRLGRLNVEIHVDQDVIRFFPFFVPCRQRRRDLIIPSETEVEELKQVIKAIKAVRASPFAIVKEPDSTVANIGRMFYVLSLTGLFTIPELKALL